jgi:hypothetical protein
LAFAACHPLSDAKTGQHCELACLIFVLLLCCVVMSFVAHCFWLPLRRFVLVCAAMSVLCVRARLDIASCLFGRLFFIFVFSTIPMGDTLCIFFSSSTQQGGCLGV